MDTQFSARACSQKKKRGKNYVNLSTQLRRIDKMKCCQLPALAINQRQRRGCSLNVDQLCKVNQHFLHSDG